MKQLLTIVGILAVILLVGCTTQQKDTSASAQVPAPGNEGVNEKIVVDESNSIDVSIQDFSFKPAEVRIKKGTTVKWTNLDSAQHSVTANVGTQDSGLLSRGESWSYTFDEEGEFYYHCSLHPPMKGVIIVE